MTPLLVTATVGAGAPAGTAVVDQVKAGCTAIALPNWSNSSTTNVWLAADTVKAEVGLTIWPPAVLTTSPVAVWLTTACSTTETPDMLLAWAVSV